MDISIDNVVELLNIVYEQTAFNTLFYTENFIQYIAPENPSYIHETLISPLYRVNGTYMSYSNTLQQECLPK